MDARTYLDTHGEARVKAVIATLSELPGQRKKCTVGYFKQIAYGYRRSSYELAQGLAKASVVVAAERGDDDVLDVDALMKARELHAARQSDRAQEQPPPT